MALPFIAIWIPTLLDKVSGKPFYLLLVSAGLWIAIGISIVRNVEYLRLGNSDQLRVVANAERLLGPEERYFDGNGMLPNRWEPSTLWLDRPMVIKTLRENKRSEAYRIFSDTPPKIVIWSYRMDAIEPVVGPLIRARYVHVAPNIWMAGRRVTAGPAQGFKPPVSGRYRLYDDSGHPLPGTLEVDGKRLTAPFGLTPGPHTVGLLEGTGEALLLPEGQYIGELNARGDYLGLFDGVYD